MLLLALGLPWAANAQETLTVYANETTTNSYVPVWGLWADNSLQCEIVYPASELEDMAGGEISALKFYTSSTSTNIGTASASNNWDGTFKIFMKEVEATTLSAFTGTTGATTVLEGQKIGVVNGEMTIEFTNTYTYGGGNLLVGVYYTTGGHYCSVEWHGKTVSGASIYGRSGQSYSATQGNFIPKTTFTYEPASADCPNPRTLVASDVTAHSATMTWTMEDETGDYQFNLEYKKTTEGDNEWHRIGIGNTRTYPLSGLDAETEYNVRIQTACDPENDKWKNGSNFTTLVACPAPTNLAVAEANITANEATATWTGTSESYVVSLGVYDFTATPTVINVEEGFEHSGNMATGWTHIGNGSLTINSTSSRVHTGTYSLRFSGATADNVVVLPEFEAEANSLTISYWSLAENSSYSGSFDVGYVTDATDASTFHAVNTNAASEHLSYTHVENISMAEAPAGAHIAFRHRSVSTSYWWWIDDITISGEVYPLNWTEYTTTNQTYTFENLTPNTPYQVKVKGNCGSEGYSAEVGPVSFTTEVSCTAPTGLAVVEGSLTAHEVTIAWDAEEGDVFEYYLSNNASVTPETVGFNTLTQTHNEHWSTLTGDTDYFFFLRKKCSETDYSETITLTFHTLEACPAPTAFEVDEESITAHTATLSWEGTSNSYNVYYRTAAYWDGLEEGFGTSLPTGWENKTGLLSTIMDGGSFSTSTQWSFGNSNSVFDFHAKINIYGGGTSERHGWLITPEITIGDGFGFTFDLALTAYSGTGAASGTCEDDRFVVLVTTDNEATWTILREWNNSGSDDVYNSISTAGENVSIDLSAYNGRTVKIAFYGESTVSGNGDNNLHIDNVVIGLPVAAGEWMNVTTNETTAELTRLVAETDYEVYVQGDCDSEGLSYPTETLTFTTDIACPAPTALQMVEGSLKHDQVTLSWTGNGETNWGLGYSWSNEQETMYIQLDDITENPYTLTGLSSHTTYTVFVYANCGEDGTSHISNSITFTTLEECPVPTDVTVSNIGHYSADVNWTGDSERFNVIIGTIDETRPFNTQNFENESLAAFTNDETNAWIIWDENPNNGSLCMASGNYNVSNSTATITLTAEFASDGLIEFYSRVSSEGGSWDYGYFSIDNVEQYREGGETPNSWTKRSYEVSAGSHTFNWSYRKDGSVDKGEDRYYIDDIVLSTATYAWTTYTTENNAYSFEGLEIGTVYKVKVIPSCDETSESDIVSFTTVSENEKYFITEGDWGTAANWEPAGAPTIDQNVTLFANATITGEAEAKSIAGTGTGEGTYTLTIEDGGKLKHLNSGVRATVKKTIGGYGEGINAEGNPSGYYLIANPITSSVTPSADNGFLVGDYDLYNWNYTQDLEWKNYKVSTFTLSSGAYGYLYANETGTDLIYTGTISAYTSYKYRGCSTASNPDNYDFPSWYLLGNPYLYDAYLAGASTNGNALPYIKMNVDGDGFENVAAGTPIAPMEGFFYQGVSGATSAYVVTYEPTIQDEGKLNMNLRKGNKQLDNAILVFGGNQQMGKMTFRANSSKIYMPVEGKDYAIVSTESNIGEMPVNFKAENNGSYTLSFNTEEVSFAYLHLIDNMTGTETDLLATPSYSFEARTTDYESRFKLVFATGNNANDDAFAFYSNGSFVINNEGNATLQVIDINGRILKSESINGCANVNVKAAAGVYMLRLVNGDNVKVQKVVVR